MRSDFPSTLKSMLFPPLAGAKGQSSVSDVTPQAPLSQAGPSGLLPPFSTHDDTQSETARNLGKSAWLLVSLQRGLPDGVLGEYKQDALLCQVRGALAVSANAEIFSPSSTCHHQYTRAPPSRASA